MKPDRPFVGYVNALGILALATLACLALRARINPTSVAMILLLAIVFIAARYDRGPAVFASVLATAVFDLLFIPPYNVFTVHDESYFVTFAVMLIVALSMTRLTATIRDQAREAREGEARSVALFALREDLARARDRAAILEATARHASQAAHGIAVIVMADRPGEQPRWPSNGAFEDVEARVAAGWAFDHGEAAGAGTGHLAASEALMVPLRISSRVLGVIAVQSAAPGQLPTTAASRTVQAMADQAALALEMGNRSELPTPVRS